MCNRARYNGEIEAIFGARKLLYAAPRDNRFNLRKPQPKARAYVIRECEGDFGLRGEHADIIAPQRPYPAEAMARRRSTFPTRGR
jgi:hypothetical protein